MSPRDNGGFTAGDGFAKPFSACRTWSNRVYTAGKAAALGTQLARLVRGTDLVRTRPAAGGTTAKVDNAEVTRFIAALRAAGADKIKNADGLPPVLGIKLEAALVANATLKKRWEGGMDDLPKPDDRSSLDFSIAGLLKLEGFSHVDTGLTLCACVHSKANVDWWKQPKDRLRHVARCVLNSDEPQTKSVWPEPIDFLADAFATPPELHAEHLPTALWPFVTDTATRMGVDPTSVAMGCLVSCASVVNDRWVIQPKRSDHLWTENPRIWAAIVGDPSIRKSPVIAACTGPIDRLDTEARLHHKDEMRAYKAALAARKEDKEAPEPILPKLSRYIIEGATVEAISEVLRDDDDAKHYAPAGKVLARHGEMSEFFGNLDRYTGGKGGGDRGAYLRLYDGGRYTVDRIGRGAFVVPNWSACILGGIQPGPIQRIAKDAAEDGLLQRFMYSVPGADGVGVDRAPDAAAIERYETLIPNLAKLSRFDQRVTLDTRAHRQREHIDAMARALQVWPDTSPRLKAAFGKWPGLFARLCLLFHLINIADSRTTTVVPESTARRVSDFMMDIVLPHLLRADAVMFATAATGHARWIAGYILATKLTRITTRDITRAYHPLRAPERAAELSEVMMSLVTIGWLEPEVPANRSRPVWAWAVNPAVHLKFAKVAADERQRRDKARGNLAQYIAEIRKRRSL